MIETTAETTAQETWTGNPGDAELARLHARVAALAARQRAAEGRLTMLLGPGACPPVASSAGAGDWWDAELGSLFGLALALRRDLAVLRQVSTGSLLGVRAPVSVQA
jgi:hypothetical protein